MKWKRFDKELPELDDHILILLESMVSPTKYLHWISSGKFTFNVGLVIHAPIYGQTLPSRAFAWRKMIKTPCDSETEESLIGSFLTSEDNKCPWECGCDNRVECEDKE